MKTKSTLALAMGAVFLTAVTGSVKATPLPIAGIISYSGSSKIDHGNHKDSAKLKKMGKNQVGKAGTLTGNDAGSAASIKPFAWEPVGANVPKKPLWSIESGGNKHAFQFGSLGVNFNSPNAQVLSGFGKASISNPGKKLNPPGLGNVSGQKPGKPSLPSTPSIKVPRPASNHVPDGGTSAMLLGFSVLGFGLLKLKSAA